MFQKNYRFRLLLLGLLSLLAFAAIEVRLYYLQVIYRNTYLTRAAKQQNRTFRLSPRRGNIVDRNGETLATSYFTDRIVLDTRKFPNPLPAGLIRDLATALELPQDRIQQLIDHPGRRTAYPLKGTAYSKPSQDICEDVSHVEDRYELPDSCVVYDQPGHRSYPNGALAAHVLGFTQIDKEGNDNIGKEGLELQYNKWLSGSYQEQKLPVNVLNKGLSPMSDEVVASTFGDTLVLTLDSQIQMFVERALKSAVQKYTALGGVAVVMNVQTGDVLALASCPDYDPNNFSTATANDRRNRVLTDPIEIGSVMKIITATLLIDRGLLSPDEMIDCKGGFAMVEGRRVVDEHKMGVVPYWEAFAESSNIAHAILAYRLETNAYYEGLVRFGLGSPSGIDLPGEASGKLREPQAWKSQTRGSIGMGYEASLTAIQVASFVSAVGNGGLRMKPHLVHEIRSAKGASLKTFPPQVADTVASPQTCATVRRLMQGVVAEGTGDKASVPGYKVGGKTGTSVKNLGRDHPRKYYAGFAGLIPLDDPQLAIYVYIDEPHGAKFGGTVAAPIFSEIAKGATYILKIPPSDPEAYNRALAAEQVTTVTAQSAAPSPEDEDSLTDMPEVNDTLTTSSTDPRAVPMPDCMGLTMVEAWNKLTVAGIRAKMVGSGIVVRQEPPAGDRVAPAGLATLIFAHPSETVRNAVTTGTATATQTPAAEPTPDED